MSVILTIVQFQLHHAFGDSDFSPAGTFSAFRATSCVKTRVPASMAVSAWTEIVIPVVRIVFSLVQRFLVSLMKVTPECNAPPSGPNSNKNGDNDYLIEEDDGLNDQKIVTKCAEIQNAISEEDSSLNFVINGGQLLLQSQMMGLFLVMRVTFQSLRKKQRRRIHVPPVPASTWGSPEEDQRDQLFNWKR